MNQCRLHKTKKHTLVLFHTVKVSIHTSTYIHRKNEGSLGGDSMEAPPQHMTHEMYWLRKGVDSRWKGTRSRMHTGRASGLAAADGQPPAHGVHRRNRGTENSHPARTRHACGHWADPQPRCTLKLTAMRRDPRPCRRHVQRDPCRGLHHAPGPVPGGRLDQSRSCFARDRDPSFTRASESMRLTGAPNKGRGRSAQLASELKAKGR